MNRVRHLLAALGLIVFAAAATADEPPAKSPKPGETVTAPAPRSGGGAADDSTSAQAQAAARKQEIQDKVAILRFRLQSASDVQAQLAPLFDGAKAAEVTAAAVDSMATARVAASRVVISALQLQGDAARLKVAETDLENVLKAADVLVTTADAHLCTARANRAVIFRLLDHLRTARAHQPLIMILSQDTDPFIRRIAADFLSEVAVASDKVAVRSAATTALGLVAQDAGADRLVRLAATTGLGRIAEFPLPATEPPTQPEKSYRKQVTTMITEVEQKGNATILPKQDGKQAGGDQESPMGTVIAPVVQPLPGPNKKP